MPTTRPRHVITETDEIEHALDDAARRWPDDSTNRRALLLRLVAEGHRAVTSRQAVDIANRLEAVASTSGALTGVYGVEYLTDLRQDWPE